MAKSIGDELSSSSVYKANIPAIKKIVVVTTRSKATRHLLLSVPCIANFNSSLAVIAKYK